MNRKSLQKIKEALLKESPNIEYALGILDTLMDSLPEEKNGYTKLVEKVTEVAAQTYSESIDDEQAILEATAKTKLADVMKMANESLNG